MKRFVVVCMVMLFAVAGTAQAKAGWMAIPDPNTGVVVTVGEPAEDPPGDPAAESSGPLGSNPQSGDGVSDGSVLDSPNGPNRP